MAAVYASAVLRLQRTWATTAISLFLFILLLRCHASPNVFSRSYWVLAPFRTLEATRSSTLSPAVTIPALLKRRKNNAAVDEDATVEVSTRLRRPSKEELDRKVQNLSKAMKGSFYGLSSDQIRRLSKSEGRPKKRLSMEEALSQTLQELQTVRSEMERLRLEMHDMRQSFPNNDGVRSRAQQSKGSVATAPPQTADDDSTPSHGTETLQAKRKRYEEYEHIAHDVEDWAEQILFHEIDGWKEVACNRVVRGNFNADGRTQASVKWMKDSRGKHADPSDSRLYPCIRVYSTIDAPLDEVCLYLSQQARMDEYNDLMEDAQDLEELTPYSKVCWSATHQILFVKPRELITLCHHKWLRDGTQLIVHQACATPPSSAAAAILSQRRRPQAYAIRGASYISHDPHDDNRTRICLVSHASPGADVPHWATHAALNALAPIEPFKLMARMNAQIIKVRQELKQSRNTEHVVSSNNNQSSRPAGMASLGYACFWPQGGGYQDNGRSLQLESRKLTPSSETEAAGTQAALDGNDPAAAESANVDTIDDTVKPAARLRRHEMLVQSIRQCTPVHYQYRYN